MNDGRFTLIKPNDKKKWNRINYLLKCHCEGTEIAASLGCHPDTLYNAVKKKYGMAFSAYAAEKRSAGKVEIREAIFQSVKKGESIPERIFWSKNYLGMSDQPMPSNDQSKALADAVEKLEVVE